MRGIAWAFGGAAVLFCLLASSILTDPVPSSSDALGFALLSAGLISGFLAAASATSGQAWWKWWIPAAWIALDVAALFLAYKDTFWIELGLFGPIEIILHIAIHMLIAPIEIGLGFVVGFVEPAAWIVVLACLATAILGAELIRRRLWPRASVSRADQDAGG